MAFGYVWMGYITARTAGRLATFTSLTAMIVDGVRIDCTLQDDVRLLEGIPVIVSHAATNAGIPAKPREALALGTLDACRRALAAVGKKNSGDSTVRLLVDEFHDRIEITIESAVADLSTAFPAYEQTAPWVADCIEKENGDGVARLRFIKYCGALDSKQS